MQCVFNIQSAAEPCFSGVKYVAGYSSSGFNVIVPGSVIFP